MADLIDRDALLQDMGLTDAVKYGNKDAEQQYRSYSTWMSYEIADSIRDAPAVNRWIPCSERLPENFVWCLVCMSDGCIRLGKWDGEYDEQGVWWVSHPNSGGKLYRIKNAPFWMPLPEPPEMER